LSKTILVIEDDRDTQILMKIALKQEGFNVITKSSAKEAFDHLKAGTLPDLILLDLSLGDMPGAEFISILRATSEWSHLKVIIVSGWDDLRAKAQDLNADGFIRKPFELSALYDQVERHL
jgi:two-component system phosphate regulon response regulator PhoB